MKVPIFFVQWNFAASAIVKHKISGEQFAHPTSSYDFISK